MLGVTAIIGMLFPVFNINIGDTANEELKLALIEDVDKIGRDELIETCYKSVELLLNSFLDPPFGDEAVVDQRCNLTIE